MSTPDAGGGRQISNPFECKEHVGNGTFEDGATGGPKDGVARKEIAAELTIPAIFRRKIVTDMSFGMSTQVEYFNAMSQTFENRSGTHRGVEAGDFCFALPSKNRSVWKLFEKISIASGVVRMKMGDQNGVEHKIFAIEVVENGSGLRGIDDGCEAAPRIDEKKDVVVPQGGNWNHL